MTIQDQFNLESSKENPNTLLLSILSKILDRGTITLEEWKSLGRFIPKKQFLDENPTGVVLASCVEVIQYPGAHYIQVMESGTFRYNSKIHSKILDQVEDIVWFLIFEKLWCNKC
jgi:hypothetical protein